MHDIRHTETRDGFDIRLEYLPEDHDWRDDFDPACHDFNEIQAKLDSGEWEFFCAHVIASKGCLDLGHDYLGSCLYASPQEFIASSYYEYMVAVAIAAAKQAIAALQ